MCACRQKKSFLIEDILQDVKKKPYKNLSYEPTQPLQCKGTKEVKPVPVSVIQIKNCAHKDVNLRRDNFEYRNQKNVELVKPKQLNLEKPIQLNQQNAAKVFRTDSLVVKKDLDVVVTEKFHLDQRRNTYPLYPMAIKANVSPAPWAYGRKETPGLVERPPFSYYSDPMLNLNSNQILRNQLAANRFVTHPFAMRQAYGFDRAPSCCSPWWGLGGRRKGGQVRFTATQTGSLERRFSASKYLSPDERRALANTLRLSDRQVKTWFQNRRAKWRRTTPDAADAGSPPTADEGSDDDVHIADD